METRTLFDTPVAAGGPAVPEVRRTQSRIRALNGRRRSLQSDADRQRRRVNARRRIRARVEEMDDVSRSEWHERRAGLRALD